MARDAIHDVVKRALEKDGWTIFQRKSIQFLVTHNRLSLITVNTQTEEIVQWIEN